jgi:transcriptional regulator
MYTPAHFRVDDPEVLERFLADHPLACAVASADGELGAKHLPLKLIRRADGQRVLFGHLVRANDLWRRQPGGAPVLAVLSGADRYVAPARYEAKATTGEVVPT